MTAGRSRARGPARGGVANSGFLMGVCVGVSLALVLGAVAFITTRPGEQAATAGPAPSASAGRGGAGTAQQPAAIIDVTARHLGNLQVQVEAQVSAPTSYDPITMAQVVAYTDMVAMPLSHRQGPIVMAEASGRKGLYQAVTTLPMPGEYDIAVEVKRPMAAVAHERLMVDTT